MKILLVHQYFLGKDDAGGSRWNQFAKYFSRAGHEVTILAGMVHYAKGTKAPQYKGKFIVEEEDPQLPGVKIIRCHVSEAYNRSFLGRFWAYLSFFFSSMCGGLLKITRPDVIIATSPPLTVAPTMWLLSRCYGCASVFEVRDLWPESAIDTGVLKSKPIIWLSYQLEKLAYRTADWVNVLTPAFEEALVSRKGVAATRVSMIPNGADLDIMKPGPKDNQVRRRLGLAGKFVVSYFGAHGRANRVGQLLDVAEQAKSALPELRILLVGDGMEKPALVEDARRRGLDNVIFVDAVPKDQVCHYINASDACTAVLMKNDTFKTVYPNKVFDYMSCRRPVIIAIDGVARKLVQDAGAGLYVEPENPAQFIAAVKQLQADPALCQKMGDQGYLHAATYYSREGMAKKYLAVLEKLTG
jgi:glycosyltransferase involved in cell wall biosynthesis